MTDHFCGAVLPPSVMVLFKTPPVENWSLFRVLVVFYFNSITSFKDLVKFLSDQLLGREKTPELPEPTPHSRFGWPSRSPETNRLKSVQTQMFLFGHLDV